MTVSSTTELRRTPLYDRHAAAGARLVPFAGWEMPVQYAGIREEHVAVRERAGVFDVSHMGQVETSGPQALEFLQRLLSNDLRRMPEGGAQYSVMLREDGGVIDDLFTYRLSDNTFLTVTNAANHEKDLAWMQAHAGEFDVDVFDRAADFAMLAVQGPKARGIVRGLADGNLPGRFRVCERTVAGAAILVCGTGYTGEDGVELLLRPDDAPSVWDAITHAGATPVGLGARDTLRLEVCFHLYGNDMDEGSEPDRGRPRVVLQGANRLHRLRGRGQSRARRAPRRSSSRSRSRDRAFRARATPSSAVARSLAARSRRVWSAGSGWRTFPARVPMRARRSRSTCAAGCVRP